MPRPLPEAVVVVTGASSGIGRAAALRFARRGSSLGLCARGLPALRETAAECEALGATVLHRSVDVADEAAVEELAARVEERFGRIDVWVNGAAVMAYGPFEEIPSEVFRRVIETNLMGQVHGARAALKRFRRQRSGVLINMSSVWGRVSTPLVSPYVVSKNAVRAFGECLGAELALDGDIQLATIAPQAVDTPIFEHSANYAGRRIRPIPPMLLADEVAEGIERCAENPKREVNYGRAGRLLEFFYSIAPGLYRRIAHPAFRRGTLGEAELEPTPGNVLAPREPHSIPGGWRRNGRPVMRRALLDAALAGVRGLFGASADAGTREAMADTTAEDQLVSYLTDAHSIEEQALTQLRRAPQIAGDERLAAAFEEHLRETEGHERNVRQRLEAHDADPSKLKDLAGKAGGWGMLLFAQSQADTPGKLVAHAYSYEHMELATYELLRHAAELAGDTETVDTALAIGAEERRMGERLADGFDAAVEASLREVQPDDIGEQLDKYLADAHAIEQQSIQLLESAPDLVDDEVLATIFREHLEETRDQERRVAERLEQRGGSTSTAKDLAMRLGGGNLGAFFGAQPDTTAKLAGFAYAFEHLEIGAYELLKRVAERAGDQDTAVLAETILRHEREAAQQIASTWDRAMRLEMPAPGS